MVSKRLIRKTNKAPKWMEKVGKVGKLCRGTCGGDIARVTALLSYTVLI